MNEITLPGGVEPTPSDRTLKPHPIRVLVRPAELRVHLSESVSKREMSLSGNPPSRL